MREITTYCKSCGKMFKISSTWFGFVSIDEINCLRLWLHIAFKHPSEIVSRKKFIVAFTKTFLLLLGLLVLDSICAVLKIILYPFYYIYARVL